MSRSRLTPQVVPNNPLEELTGVGDSRDGFYHARQRRG